MSAIYAAFSNMLNKAVSRKGVVSSYWSQNSSAASQLQQMVVRRDIKEPKEI